MALCGQVATVSDKLRCEEDEDDPNNRRPKPGKGNIPAGLPRQKGGHAPHEIRGDRIGRPLNK